MTISIDELKNKIQFDDIKVLTKAVGWGEDFYSTNEKWTLVLKRSIHVTYIKDHEKLIGFGRILEDGLMCMFYDICIHAAYQRQRLGTLLMNHLLDKVKDKDYNSIGLFTWEGNKTVAEFYKNLGFIKTSAMQLKKR